MKKFSYLLLVIRLTNLAHSSSEEFQNKNIYDDKCGELSSSEVIDTNDEEYVRNFMINYGNSEDGKYTVIDVEKIFIYRVAHMLETVTNEEFVISWNLEDLKFFIEVSEMTQYECVDAKSDEKFQDFIKKLYTDKYYNNCDIFVKVKNYYHLRMYNLDYDFCECFININSTKEIFDEVNNHTEESIWNPYVRYEDRSDIDIVDMFSLMKYYYREDICPIWGGTNVDIPVVISNCTDDEDSNDDCTFYSDDGFIALKNGSLVVMQSKIADIISNYGGIDFLMTNKDTKSCSEQKKNDCKE